MGLELGVAPSGQPADRGVVNDVIELARKHGFSTRNPLGTITVFNGEEHLFLNEDGEAIAGVAAGIHHLTLWSSDVDSFLYCQREPDRVGDGITVTWYLDSAWTYRKGRPKMPADEFRRLYQQRTAMWVDGAESLDVMHGRIADESLLERSGIGPVFLTKAWRPAHGRPGWGGQPTSVQISHEPYHPFRCLRSPHT
ncbi:hypothetical protein [Allorhizocola rhizosphaerae]|uniref:hypothetical protein n=1 Tax=Allorhizocola rhizosphaerae TaxID=1872709 RepID=UPI0013C2B896|nr:hypothetical protein [Allorhizocola rhizosphaerae]